MYQVQGVAGAAHAALAVRAAPALFVTRGRHAGAVLHIYTVFGDDVGHPSKLLKGRVENRHAQNRCSNFGRVDYTAGRTAVNGVVAGPPRATALLTALAGAAASTTSAGTTAGEVRVGDHEA